MKFSGFNTTEKVGIGVGASVPEKDLTVQSATSPAIGLYSTYADTNSRNWAINTNNSAYGDFTISTSAARLGNPTTIKMSILKDGKVGIGTTAPYGQLHVNASNYGESPTINKALLVSDSADVTKYLILTYHASVDVGIIQGLDDSLAWKNVAINPNGGSVGIGTTSPSVGLEVAKTSADASFKVNRTDQTNIQLIAAGSSYVRASAALILQSNGANNRLTLAADGSSTFSGNVLVNGTGTFSTAVAVGDAYIYTNYIRSSNLRVTDNGYLGSQSVPSVIQIQGDGDVAIGYPTTINSSLKATTILDASNSAGTNGQVLTSTGSALDWKTLSEISGVDGSGTANYIPKWTDSDTIGNSSIHEAGAGSLQIEGPSAGRFLTLNAPTTGGYITFETADTAFADIGTAKAISGNAAYSTTDLMINTRSGTKNIVFGMNGVEKVRIDNNGKVGIGTTAPGSLLNLYASAQRQFHWYAGTSPSGNNYVSTIGLGRAKGSASMFEIKYDSEGSEHAYISRLYTNATLHFDKAGTDHMTIKSDGKVGIGTTAPSSKLTVESNSTGESISDGLRIHNSHGETNDISPIYFGVHGGTRRAKCGIGWKRTGSYGIGKLLFALDNNGDDADVSFANDTKITFQGDGNVGIGTTAPGAKLEVRGGSATIPNLGSYGTMLSLRRADGLIGLSGDIDSATNGFWFQAQNSSSPVATAIILNPKGGRVGVETSVTGGHLDVAATGTETLPTLLVGYASDANRGNHRLAFYTDSETGYISNRNGDNGIRFRHRQNTVMQVGKSASEPFVGIGTTAPGAPLEVVGGSTNNNDTANVLALTGSEHIRAIIDTSSTAGHQASLVLESNSNEVSIATTGSNEMRFNAGGSESVRINSNGNVGIGTVSPSSKLHVNGSGAVHGQYLRISNGSTQVYELQPSIVGVTNNGFGVYDVTDSAYRLAIDTSGNVGIGTNVTSPTSQLQIIGDAATSGLSVKSGGNGGKYPFRVTWSGGTEGDVFCIDDNLRVGIGTTAPSTKFQVHSGDILITSGKQLISTNSYTQAPGGMLTIQGPSVGNTTLSSNQWGIMIGPQHTRSATAGSTYYPGIAFNHLLNHGGVTGYNNAPQAWIGTRLYDTPGSERDCLVFSTKSGTGVAASDVPIERMCIDPFGKVGIGTTAPVALLNVYSATANANGIANIKQATATNNPTLVVEQTVSGGNANVNQGLVVKAVGTGDGSGNTLHVYQRDNSATGLVVKGSGKVGIGNNRPIYQLHLQDDSAGGKMLLMRQDASLTGQMGEIAFGQRSYDDYVCKIRATLDSTGPGATGTGGFISFDTEESGGDLTERLRISSDGKVGIGTDPSYKFEVVTGTSEVGFEYDTHANGTQTIKFNPSSTKAGGTSKIYSSYAGTGATEGKLALGTYSDQTALVIDGGKVLIGGSTALGPFGEWNWTPLLQQLGTQGIVTVRCGADVYGGAMHLASARGSNASPTIVLNGDRAGGVYYHAYDGVNFSNTPAAIECFIDGAPAADDTPGRLVFSTAPDGSNSITERMRITSAGKVGIGTTSPSAKLDVSSPAGTGVALAVKGGNNLVDNILLNLLNQSGTTVLNVRNNGALYGTAATFSGRIVGNDFEMLDSSGTGRTLVVRHSGNQVQFGDGSTFSIFRFNGTQVIPHADSTATLGTNALRWSTIYGDAGNFSEVMNLSGVNKIHQLSGHNFLQGDATMTYLYGGSGGGQIRTANNASSLIQWLDNGKVGIGNTSPDFKLEVGNAGGTLNTEFRIVGEKAISAAVSGISTYLWADGTTHGLNAWNYAGGAHPDLYIGWAGKNVLLNALGAGGDVGIGTTTPAAHLHINKSSGTTTVLTQVAAGSTVGYEIKKTGSTTQHWKIVDGQTANGYLEIYDATDSATRMAFNTNGNVGIGTVNAPNLLTLKGDSKYLAMYASDGSEAVRLGVDSSGDGQLRLMDGGGNTRIFFYGESGANSYINNGGNLGIGTTTPGSELDIEGSHTAVNEGAPYGTGSTHINLKNTSDTDGNLTGVLFEGAVGTAYMGGMYMEMENHSSFHSKLHFATRNAGSFGSKMVLAKDGKVGIGTANPTQQLMVWQGSSSVSFGEFSNGAVIWLDGVNGDLSGGDYFNILADSNTALRFGYGTANKVSMLSSGRFGIGVDTPSNLLSVEGSVSGDYLAEFKQGHSTAGQSYGVNITAGTNASDQAFRVANQAESTLLQVCGDGEIRVAGQTLVDNSLTNYKMTFPNLSGIAMGSAYTYANIYGSGGDLYLKANAYGANLGNNPSKIYLVTAGNSGSSAPDVVVKGGKVGIGTDAPSSPLQVTIPASQGLTDFGGVTFQETANRRGLSMGWDNSSGYFWFYSRDVGVASRGINLNNALYVKSLGGNVGIGVTAPGAKLHVTGAPGNSTYLSYLFNSATHSEANGLNVQIASSGSSAMGLRVNTGGDSNAFIVAGDGDTGLGFTPSNFAQKLNVNGGAYINGFVGIGTASTMSSSAELLGVYSASTGHASFKNSSDSTGTVYIRNVSTNSKYLATLLDIS